MKTIDPFSLNSISPIDAVLSSVANNEECCLICHDLALYFENELNKQTDGNFQVYCNKRGMNYFFDDETCNIAITLNNNLKHNAGF